VEGERATARASERRRKLRASLSFSFSSVCAQHQPAPSTNPSAPPGRRTPPPHAPPTEAHPLRTGQADEGVQVGLSRRASPACKGRLGRLKQGRHRVGRGGCRTHGKVGVNLLLVVLLLGIAVVTVVGAGLLRLSRGRGRCWAGCCYCRTNSSGSPDTVASPLPGRGRGPSGHGRGRAAHIFRDTERRARVRPGKEEVREK